jgi:hypothetical protein
MATNTETFKVAGISHYKDDIIKNFASEIDDGEFDYKTSSVELIPEPENKYDPNAIKVLVNGIKIGYVPKELTSFARDIIDSPNFLGAEVTIFGEKYQGYNDDETDEIVDLWASIHLSTQFESEEEKKSEKNWTILAKIELILGILNFILSLIITKVSFIFFALLIITHSLYYLYKRRDK